MLENVDELGAVRGHLVVGQRYPCKVRDPFNVNFNRHGLDGTGACG
jgi:hypothetical protein